jgi:hypothetical protein
MTVKSPSRHRECISPNAPNLVQPGMRISNRPSTELCSQHYERSGRPQIPRLPATASEETQAPTADICQLLHGEDAAPIALAPEGRGGLVDERARPYFGCGRRRGNRFPDLRGVIVERLLVVAEGDRQPRDWKTELVQFSWRVLSAREANPPHISTKSDGGRANRVART